MQSGHPLQTHPGSFITPHSTPAPAKRPRRHDQDPYDTPIPTRAGESERCVHGLAELRGQGSWVQRYSLFAREAMDQLPPRPTRGRASGNIRGTLLLWGRADVMSVHALLGTGHGIGGTRFDCDHVAWNLIKHFGKTTTHHTPNALSPIPLPSPFLRLLPNRLRVVSAAGR
jgi:hypothetical protein